MITNVKDIKKIENINTLEEEYEIFRHNYSYKPNREEFPYPKANEILDENKTVKWNREEVERLRKAHDDEVKRRNQEYHIVINAFENRFKELFSEDYGIKVSEAEIIWSYSWDKGHSTGIYSVVSYFRDIASLYDSLLEVHSKKNNKKE